MINLTYQSEQQLEGLFISNLKTLHKYDEVEIRTEEELENNFRKQLNILNKYNLIKELTDKEFERVMIFIKGKSIFQSAKQLRDKFQLQRDDGSVVYLSLIDFDDISKNIFQVTNQVKMEREYKNRYDVTLLINGLPIVQVELKRRGLNIKEGFNQICRYARHSYDGLFRYLQVFIISNGVDTKYFCNNDKSYRYNLTFFWTDEHNNRITNLNDFSNAFLNKKHLMDMIDDYMVLNDTDKEMMILRPYQVYAVEKVVKMARETANGGFVWHSTGSGKSLTSFKASQVLTKDKNIKKILFVVDRSDLDSQTISEFNKFKKGSVDTTDTTNVLVSQMEDKNNHLIVTTVQKLSNAIKNDRYKKVMEQYENEKVIIIMDECHRSQFGEMHTRIKKFFNKAQFFGFTGTPRFKENKSQDGRTTADVFGKCLHTYMIKDAIFDNNVLGFSIEYIETFKGQYDERDKEEVYSIDTKEVYESEDRVTLVANHIIQCHSTKTLRSKYNALFATSSIRMLLRYYDELKSIESDLNIAAIFTFQDNEDLEDKERHSREDLDRVIDDYNEMFGTNFSSDNYAGYRTDVSKRVKNGQIDLLVVVNTFLTGFDSKKTNTVYVDKPLKYHDLLQAFSRTNRIDEPRKVWGNIVCYRNLKRETDDAIRLFNQSDGVDGVLQEDFNYYVSKFRKHLENMLEISPRPEDIDNLREEEQQAKFVREFKETAQILLALRTFIDFEFDKELIGIDEQTYEDFKSKYLMLHDNHKQAVNAGKESILDDIDFAIELVQTDRINFDYILNLIRTISRKSKREEEKDVEHIIEELKRSDSPKLRKKIDLIKSFLYSELPSLSMDISMDEAYSSFEDSEREKEIKAFAIDNDLEIEFLKNEISEYEFTGFADEEDISNKIKKPFLIKRNLVSKIIEFMRENLFKYE